MTDTSAPIPPYEADRLRNLQRLHLLDTQPEASYDDLVAVACGLCDTPIALISLIDSDRQWFKACIGLDVSETPRDAAFCAHAIVRPEEVMVVEDAAIDPRFASNPLVTGAPHIRFYAGAPIVTLDGYALGTVCVIDYRPRTLTSAQINALQRLARLTARMMQQREQSSINEERTESLQRKVSSALASDTPEHAGLRRDLRVDVVGQLTSSVAHDFNNLLQNLSVCMQLMKLKAGHPNEVRRWAESGLKTVGQGAKLIAQLLSFSREQSPVSGKLSVSEHLDAMRELLRRTLPSSVTLRFDLETTGCLVLINATQLEAAVLNMVINSRDAMCGCGTIDIITRRFNASGLAHLEDGEYIELAICDDGPGMPSDVATRAFEPFFTTKGEGKGTGLGLSQVIGVAHRAGGTAQILSSKNGTTITMYLRVAAGANQPRQPVVDVTLEKVTRQAKLLIVEDVEEIRAPMAALLSAQGYTVTAVGSGVDALKALEIETPDLVLTDLGMQGMSGALLSRVLSEMYPRVPVLFMSADYDLDAARVILPADAILLRKPIMIDDLVVAIEQKRQPLAGSRG